MSSKRTKRAAAPVQKDSPKKAKRAAPTAEKEKDSDMNAEEKLHIAHFYADYKDLLEGKLEGASKTGESKREKAFEQLAGELTAMGYGVRTVKRVKIKLKAMKARASKKVSKEKIEQNRTGGGVGQVFMTPSTKVLVAALAESDAQHGIPGAVDSNNPGTLSSARKRLQFGESSRRRSESSDEDHEHEDDTELPAETVLEEEDMELETPMRVRKPPKPKRIRHDSRKSYSHSPLNQQMCANQQRLVDAEVQLSEARLELVRFQIAHKKLEIFKLCQGLTYEQQNEALTMTIPNETVFIDGDV